jgi:putative FmdB family regulatory protein
VPLYEYECGQCGCFELIKKFSDPPVTTCPTCGREVTKLVSSPAIQFKGTGWYVTDYARKSEGGTPNGGKTEPGKESKEGSKESKDSKDSKEGSSSSKSTESTSSSPQSSTSKDSSASGSSSSK